MISYQAATTFPLIDGINFTDTVITIIQLQLVFSFNWINSMNSYLVAITFPLIGGIKFTIVTIIQLQSDFFNRINSMISIVFL